MVLKFWILALGCLIISCFRYKPNKLAKQYYFGNEMRIDGYYFSKKIIERDSDSIDVLTTTLVFFRNGFMTSSTFVNSNLEAITQEITKNQNPYKVLEGSGYFQVKDSALVVEFWVNASHFPVPTARLYGKIVNDTVIECPIYGRTESDLWHFRPLSIKPDSTTIFDEQLENGIPINRKTFRANIPSRR